MNYFPYKTNPTLEFDIDDHFGSSIYFSIIKMGSIALVIGDTQQELKDVNSNKTNRFKIKKCNYL